MKPLKNGTENKIEALELDQHLKVMDSLEKFWLSQTDTIKPYHHFLFPLLFSGFSYVLYSKDNLVSYLYGACSVKTGFLHLIATRPDMHRHGYASSLINHWEKEARKRLLRNLLAYTLEDNRLSIGFLTKNGYRRLDTISIGHGEKRVLFEKKLHLK